MCGNSNVKKRRNPNISVEDDAYDLAKLAADKRNETLTSFTTQLIKSAVEKESFLKLYAPNLSVEYVSPSALFLSDTTKADTVIVKVKQHKIESMEDSGIFVLCETCQSDSCIHVRFAMALPELSLLKRLEK